jgi:SAM-dependent methyltransferase
MKATRSVSSRHRANHRPDRHVLYEAAVQAVDYDLDFVERVYRGLRRREPQRLREDFCGTGALAGAWVLRGPRRRAWGVDRDRTTLAWAQRHRLPRLGEAARRLTLEHRDVRVRTHPKVDVVVALNFSYWVFHHRRDLLAYFESVRRSLRRGGLLVLNAFGGTESMAPMVERRRISASTSIRGDRIPPFTYEWEQVSFNPIDHRLRCYIHFRFRDGSRIQRAFRYDWRLWTLPEIGETLRAAGFDGVRNYIEGWDDENHRPADHHLLRKRFENQEGWLAFVVGVT